MSAAENFARWPTLALRAAYQDISGSNHTISKPQHFRERLSLDKFVVRKRAMGLFTRPI